MNMIDIWIVYDLVYELIVGLNKLTSINMIWTWKESLFLSL
jgi:hypothetical protein